MSGPEKSTSDLVAESLNGITGINVSNAGINSSERVEFATAEKTDVGSSKKLLRAGGKVFDITDLSDEGVVKLLQAEKILIPPKKPTPKSSIPKDVLAPGFKKRRHKILERIKARKKGK